MAFLIVFGVPVTVALLFLFRVQVFIWQREARHRQRESITRRQQYSFESAAWTGLQFKCEGVR